MSEEKKEINYEEVAGDLQVQVEELAKRIAVMKQNESGLISENNQLRSVVDGNSKLIYKRLLDLKCDISSVGKDQKNDFGGWNFRGIDQMLNYFKPLMDKHRIGLNINTKMYSEPKFVTNEKNGKSTKHCNLILEYEFFTDDGSSVTNTVPAEAVATDDKGTAKALSQGLKYLLIQSFVTPTEDVEDPDRGVVDVKPAEKKAAPKLVTKAKTTKKSSSFRRKKAEKSVEGLDELEEL